MSRRVTRAQSKNCMSGSETVNNEGGDTNADSTREGVKECKEPKNKPRGPIPKGSNGTPKIWVEKDSNAGGGDSDVGGGL